MQQNRDKTCALQIFHQFKNRIGDKKDKPVNKGVIQCFGAYSQGLHILITAYAREKARYFRFISAIWLAETVFQISFLCKNNKKKSYVACNGEQERNAKAAGHAANAESSNGAEYIKRIAAERIGTGADNLCTFVPANMQCAPHAAKNSHNDKAQAESLNIFMNPVRPRRTDKNQGKKKKGDNDSNRHTPAGLVAAHFVHGFHTDDPL